MNRKTDQSNSSAPSNKKSGRKSLYLQFLFALTAMNLVLIVLLLAKLSAMSNRIDRLNTLISEEAALNRTLPAPPEDMAYTTVSGNDALFEDMAALSPSVIILSGETIAPDSYAAQCLSDYVEPPVERSERAVLRKLLELSADNEDLLYIYNNRADYPIKMLENLVNNPEMTGYVRNYTGSAGKASGGFTDSEKSEQYPLLLQWDERWGYVSYGDDSVIGLAGCGPTCLSMVLFSLTRDESLTPDLLANYAMENGYYMFGTGTMWALFEEVPPLYGVTSENLDKKDDELIFQALNDGKMLVFSVGPGEFTAYGHFIVVYGIDEEGRLLVNDPNCVYRSTQHWDYQKIKNQIKSIWSFDYDHSEID